MWGRGSSNLCVCVCLCVCFHSSEHYECFKSQSKDQQKALDAGNKINVGTELT